MRAVIASTFLAAVVLVPCWGCGSSGGAVTAQTVPVKGKVTFQGKPLTKGHISFEPTDIGREAHGDIRPDGSFELTTFKQGDGAVAGVHKVSVTGAGRGVRTTKITEVEVVAGTTEYTVDLK